MEKAVDLAKLATKETNQKKLKRAGLTMLVTELKR